MIANFSQNMGIFWFIVDASCIYLCINHASSSLCT